MMPYSVLYLEVTHFDHCGSIALHRHSDETLLRLSALHFGGFRPTLRERLLVQPFFSRFQVVVVQREGFFAFHDRKAASPSQRGEQRFSGAGGVVSQESSSLKMQHVHRDVSDFLDNEWARIHTRAVQMR